MIVHQNDMACDANFVTLLEKPDREVDILEANKHIVIVASQLLKRRALAHARASEQESRKKRIALAILGWRLRQGTTRAYVQCTHPYPHMQMPAE
ncbi:hypothetical protein ACMZ4X_02163 [Achromobacter marplatensis]